MAVKLKLPIALPPIVNVTYGGACYSMHVKWRDGAEIGLEFVGKDGGPSRISTCQGAVTLNSRMEDGTTEQDYFGSEAISLLNRKEPSAM